MTFEQYLKIDSVSEQGRDVLCDVATERVRQDNKWGIQNNTPIEWVSILAEEVGEAAKEANDRHFLAKEGAIERYRAEMVQVAAVAIAAIENLDRSKR